MERLKPSRWCAWVRKDGTLDGLNYRDSTGLHLCPENTLANFQPPPVEGSFRRLALVEVREVEETPKPEPPQATTVPTAWYRHNPQCPWCRTMPPDPGDWGFSLIPRLVTCAACGTQFQESTSLTARESRMREKLTQAPS